MMSRAEQILHDIARERRRRLEELRGWREACKLISEPGRRRQVQRELRLRASLARRATPRRLRAEARERLAFARSPIIDYSTEYYSTCGLDDAQGEDRYHARRYARDLLAAAVLLSPRRRPSTGG